MDPHDKPPDAPPPAEPPAEHHGVVETIEEVVEEVVEHVPQPVRWTVGKLVWLTLGIVAALVFVAVVSAIAFLMNRTELVAHEVAILLNQTLAQRSNVAIELKDLKGNPLQGFRAPAPVVRFRADGARFLEAKEFRARYPLFSLIRGGRGPIELTFVEPRLALTKDADGHWRFPTWKSLPKRNPTIRGLDLVVKLERGRLSGPKPIGDVTGLDMEVAIGTGKLVLVDVRRLRWREGPFGSRLHELSGAYATAADSARFVVRSLRTDDLALRAYGGWARPGTEAAGGRPFERVVHVDLERVRWAWLAKVFDNRSFDVPGTGAATVDARGDRNWRGRFTSRVNWDSLDVAGTGRFAWDGHALAIDDLDATSPAGRVTRGQVRWSKPGWAVGGDATHANPAHWSALHLVNWPAGDLNGRFRYSVDTRKAQTAVLVADLATSEWTGWHVDSGLVRVDFPAKPALPSFDVRGRRRGGTFTLAGRVTDTGWKGPYTVRSFPLDEWPDGRATGLRGTLTAGDGEVESRNGELLVTGVLQGGQTDWSAAHFATWRLDDVRGRLLPTPEMTAHARARDGTFLGIHVDSAAAPIVLGDQTVAFDSLVASAGDTVVALRGDADWQRTGTWRMRLAAATARSSQFAWTAEPPVTLAGDAQGVVFERLVAEDQGARLEAAGRWAAPGGFYDFTANTRGLDLARLGFPADWGLSGHADTRLVVRGRPGAPEWQFTGAASAPGMSGHAADSVTVSLTGGAHTLRVVAFGMRIGSGWLRGDGEFGETREAFPDSLTSTALMRWLEDAGRWRGRVTADHLPVGRLSRLAPAAEGWSGSASGSLDASGRPQAPVLAADVTVDALGYRDVKTDKVSARARYAAGRLDVSDAEIVMLGDVSNVAGSMPLDLAFGRTPRVPDESMRWTLRVPQGDLAVLPLVVPQIQTARGAFELNVDVAGTPKHPTVVGAAHVRDGVVRPAGRQEVIEGLHADLSFDQTRITLDTLTARQGRTGRLWARGLVTLQGVSLRGYRFDLGMRDFAASEEGLYALLFDGNFVVTDGPRVGGQRLPEVSGNVRLQRGVVEFDFANQTEVQKIAATTAPLYWTYRIHLTAPSNLRWRPPDGDIEFNADLDLEQTADSLIIFGEMHALRGSYYFLSNRFTIRQADLVFDNQKGVDPVLTIVADTRLVPSAQNVVAGTSRAEPVTITATITGRASQPTIVLAGPAGWDQHQVLDELTTKRFIQGGIAQTDPLDNYVTRKLNAQLSRDLSEFFQGAITDWTIERDQGGLFRGSGDYVVGAGTSLTPELSVRYRQRIPGPANRPLDPTARPEDLFERDVEAEYRLSRFIYLTTGLTQRRATVTATTPSPGNAEFNINLKARWEY